MSQTADYAIAVVGHEAVGKSTVIRRAVKTWGGSTPVTTHTHDGFAISSCFANIKAGGKLVQDVKVEFVKVDLRALDLSGVTKVWPSQMSNPSGVILCYDAERRDTLRGLSEALHQLCPALPCVLFACKSDPGKKLEVDAQVGDSIGQPYNVGLIEVTTATPQGKHKMRTGLRWLLFRLEERQRREATKLLATAAEKAAVSTKASPALRQIENSPAMEEYSDTQSSSSSLGWIMKNTMATSGTETECSVEKNWVSLEELMNRLFTAIVSTENDQFVQAYFMTYRRFCLPRDLMKEFLDRFNEVESYAVSRDIRLWALMKLTGALVQWASQYPGDLAETEALALFRKTLALMLKHTFLASITSELVQVEQSLVSNITLDLDTSWSCSLSPRPKGKMANSISSVSDSAVEIVLDESENGDGENDDAAPGAGGGGGRKAASTRSVSTTNLSIGEVEGTDPYLRNKDLASDRTTTDSSSDLSRSIPPSINSGDDAPVISSPRWSAAVHSILHMDAHVFALELTRMQWAHFIAIRPRDVFRHDFGKERTDPVGRSIDFFNHVSRWTSTMVMASPKAKTRAKVYESFVRVTHQLRRLNNYDSLCAVISGLRETSVHRLGQTHAQVRLEPVIHREYQSHLKLMDPRGGYMHYRRALQADSTYGHSAIPLLTTILSLVSRLQAGRPEDKRADGTVQWDKFARFGQILSVIPEFQGRGTMVPGPVSATFRRLLEETPIITNEDGLYERSRLIEPGGSHGGGVLRKLANLAL